MGGLHEHLALITGGTSGIRRRTVERFVEEGARFVFTGRQEEQAPNSPASSAKRPCSFGPT